MKTLRVKFERNATIYEKGVLLVKVPDNASYEDIMDVVEDKEWKSFLITDRKYLQDEWEYELDEDEVDEDGVA